MSLGTEDNAEVGMPIAEVIFNAKVGMLIAEWKTAQFQIPQSKLKNSAFNIPQSEFH